MRSFLLKVNGVEHCPGGISNPKGNDWSGGSIELPEKEPVFPQAKKSVPVPPIEPGDTLYIWTHETKPFGNGVGLCAIATAGKNVEVDGKPHIELADVTILPRAIDKDMYFKIPITVEAIFYSTGFSHDGAYLLSAEDQVAMKALIAERDSPIREAQIAFEEKQFRDALKARLDATSLALDRQQRLAYARPEQPRFRKKVLDLYGGACILTGCRVEAALEASHIVSHNGDRFWDIPSNGLPLRRDLHGMFDAFLWSIDPSTHQVVLSRCQSAELFQDETYSALEGILVDHKAPRPAIEYHFSLFTDAEATR
ncbi:HNH endonuclease [Pseudosulfitobacter pseudonitzschiae]|uniref:HNH endonuclease n=1 Tax=Pseudosulfitobacter pseudonitzschiae TaxID=1402135 RepID=UPI003B7CB2C4